MRSKRVTLAFLGTAAALGSLVMAARAEEPATQAVSLTSRPNILWISTEDMSQRLGVYGDKLARTPVLDRLARESIRYTNLFATAPVCAPSRAAIITGMYQTTLGAQHMRTTEDRVPELPAPYPAVPPFYVKAFPEYLRAAGYYTTNRAKTDYQFGVPFTIWDDVGRAAHWRNRPDKSRPFFSVFNLEVTHESQIFPSSPARKGKPLITNPAAIDVPPYYPDTRRCGKSWRACTTTSPTWMFRSARFSSRSKTTASRRTRSCSTGAITATACRGPSARSTTPTCVCHS